jgi:hypothetical protein
LKQYWEQGRGKFQCEFGLRRQAKRDTAFARTKRSPFESANAATLCRRSPKRFQLNHGLYPFENPADHRKQKKRGRLSPSAL